MPRRSEAGSRACSYGATGSTGAEPRGSSGVRLGQYARGPVACRPFRAHSGGERPEVAIEELVEFSSDCAENGREAQDEESRQRDYESCSKGDPDQHGRLQASIGTTGGVLNS